MSSSIGTREARLPCRGRASGSRARCARRAPTRRPPTSAGRLVSPTIVTPCLMTVWPASVSGQLPPLPAPAMSTITEPGFIALTISSVTSTGAARPGISAVVMTMSAAATRLATSTFWRVEPALRHRPGVAADAFGGFLLLGGLVRHVDELGAERLDLLLDARPHVARLDHGAQPLGGGDRLQAGDADAEDDDARRLDRAGGRHQHREEALVLVGGDHHRLVAGDVGLARQHVHALRARRARRGLEREAGQAGGGQRAAGRRGRTG